MDIQDYLDKFPGQYEGEQQRYARGMDDFYRKVDAISLREYGKHYEKLDVHAQKRVESLVDRQGSSRKGGVYNDALQAHGVYHGYQDWEDTNFVPEDEALETLSDIAESEGKTVDTLVAEMSEFKRTSNPDRLGNRQGSIYQLEDGRIVNEKEAEQYRKDYVKMMEQDWEDYKKNRKGNPINNIDPKICQNVVGKNVSKLVTNRLSK